MGSSTASTASDRPSEGSESGIDTHSNPVDSKKVESILEACRWRDIGQLRALAESPGGLLSDNLREQAWPVLLGLSPERFEKDQDSSVDWKDLPRHRDEDQVQLDVDRAFVYYPQHLTEADLEKQKEELSSLIIEVLRRYPFLCYFQGYHDICQVFLLILPGPLRVPAVARLSALRIRDFMLPSLAPAVAQLRLIPDILRAADPDLWRHLSDTEPFFALSGTLTMYAHDITTLGEIARLFDVLLAREPVFGVYVFARIVMNRRAELFDTPRDEPEMLHSILSKLPQPLDLDRLVADAAALFDAHPPESLRAWRTISRASVLKTARSADTCALQSVEDGRIFFERQVRELRWLERRDELLNYLWRHRRHMRLLALAMFFGIAAVWIRRTPGLLSYTSLRASLWWTR
ncbi:hypothetical protein VTK73DRAFT_2878 [Phialemonium thermophilum]|uniref:Rab-GAP TBC domain-containing protein n=1 Tax=Phialemonium thermophilum TaxID=223376 RepID=A0ABR3X2F4_9PEZI